MKVRSAPPVVAARFELRPPFVVFHDSKPGNHATLFVEGRKLLFRGDASHFDNKRRVYAWAFEGEVKDGETVVFATDDREVSGHVRGDVIAVAAAGQTVQRVAGKPTTALPTVAEILAAPSAKRAVRPVPVRRAS